MLSYELTKDAERDLEEISRYSIKQWGESLARKYISFLETGLEEIGAKKVIPRQISKHYPQIRFTHCEHHYIFYLFDHHKKPQIVAILHENMDLLERIKDRLSP